MSGEDRLLLIGLRWIILDAELAVQLMNSILGYARGRRYLALIVAFDVLQEVGDDVDRVLSFTNATAHVVAQHSSGASVSLCPLLRTILADSKATSFLERQLLAVRHS